MKKVLLLMVIACATVSANAQLYVGGSLNFWMNDKNDVQTTTFGIKPEVGYSFNEKWAVGGVVGFSSTSTDVKDSKARTEFTIAPYARYSFFNNDLVRLFLDGGVDFTSFDNGATDGSMFAVGVKPGIALKLSERISLFGKYGFLGYQDKEDYGQGKGFGLDIKGETSSFGIFYTF